MSSELHTAVEAYERNEGGSLGFIEGDALIHQIEGSVTQIGNETVEELCKRVIRCKHYCN